MFIVTEYAALSIETNSVDPGSTLFVGKASKTFQQTTKADIFCCDWRFKAKLSKKQIQSTLNNSRSLGLRFFL